jgi:hypothetical protein
MTACGLDPAILTLVLFGSAGNPLVFCCHGYRLDYRVLPVRALQRYVMA